MDAPFVAAFRLKVTGPARTVRVHVTADERYELFLNGTRVGRGSERGDAEHWYFETYDLRLPEGESVIVARTWALGFARSPFAQISVIPGFLLCPNDPTLSPEFATGLASWEVLPLDGYQFVDQIAAWGTGNNVVMHGEAISWGVERGLGDEWLEPVVGPKGMDRRANDENPGHRLTPGTLPAMFDAPKLGGQVRFVGETSGTTHAEPILSAKHLAAEAAPWQALFNGAGSITVPPQTKRRVLYDIDDYLCAYPELVVSQGKGAKVRVNWQECLFNEPEAKTKGNRDDVEGKYFVTIWHIKDGVGDEFQIEGGQNRSYTPLWWQAGRYVEVLVETSDEALTINDLIFHETRYPFNLESTVESDDKRLTEIVPIMFRALQMCSHETYMDCPFYEQLMYIGDTRLECLVTYVSTLDDRLPRKALSMFDASRLNDGLTQSRYPSRVRQMIPPFSLWFVAMIHDYALWRGDMTFVAERMKAARLVLDSYRETLNADGLIKGPNGWNYLDWVPEWPGGIPPDGAFGVSAGLNLQYAHVLGLAADIEEWLREPELAGRYRRQRDAVLAAVDQTFWDEGRGLYADDTAHVAYSEHAQCLAVLAHVGTVDSAWPEKRERIKHSLVTAPDLARATIYFSFYLLEAFRELKLGDAFLNRLQEWFDHAENGMKTTREHPEPTRSDCHAWGAHPYWHYFATIAGIRPTKPGFAEYKIEPLPMPASVKVSLPTVRGTIHN